MQISSMFLRNVTCIDHAYIDDVGMIVGGSYHQDLLVSGEVDPVEQVVVDFSSVKKQIKQIIDDKETGFDHKLWIFEVKSKCNYFINGDRISINTPFFKLDLPLNAVKIISVSGYTTLPFLYHVETQMAKELELGLSELNAPNKITVELKLHEETFGKDHITFTYFHGLRNSTSWGCNNVAHGHTSFAEVYDDLGCRLNEIEDMIADYINGAMFVFKDNLVGDSTIQYTTSRGLFRLVFEPNSVKHIIMDKETTIENIVDFVVSKLGISIGFHGIKRIMISEGLQKGAMRLI